MFERIAILLVLLVAAFRVYELRDVAPETKVDTRMLSAGLSASYSQLCIDQEAIRLSSSSSQDMVLSSGDLRAATTVWVWDASAAVYVAAGADGLPGVAGVDDEGNGVVDDLPELGATGSDDRMLTPGQPDYEKAAAGELKCAVLSHGAMRRVEGDCVIEGPTQARIDWMTPEGEWESRIVDLGERFGAWPPWPSSGH